MTVFPEHRTTLDDKDTLKVEVIDGHKFDAEQGVFIKKNVLSQMCFFLKAPGLRSYRISLVGKLL